MTGSMHANLAERLSSSLPEISESLRTEFGVATLRVENDRLDETLTALRDAGFERLEMVTAIDRGDSYELVHFLVSRRLSADLTVRCRIERSEARVASAVKVWPAAEWQEREVFDLFGIVFVGHPDMRRILLPEEFVGHPLRRDYDDERLIRRPDYI